jgi:hypothetical protein
MTVQLFISRTPVQDVPLADQEPLRSSGSTDPRKLGLAISNGIDFYSVVTINTAMGAALTMAASAVAQCRPSLWGRGMDCCIVPYWMTVDGMDGQPMQLMQLRVVRCERQRTEHGEMLQLQLPEKRKESLKSMLLKRRSEEQALLQEQQQQQQQEQQQQEQEQQQQEQEQQEQQRGSDSAGGQQEQQQQEDT